VISPDAITFAVGVTSMTVVLRAALQRMRTAPVRRDSPAAGKCNLHACIAIDTVDCVSAATMVRSRGKISARRTSNLRHMQRTHPKRSAKTIDDRPRSRPCAHEPIRRIRKRGERTQPAIAQSAPDGQAWRVQAADVAAAPTARRFLLRLIAESCGSSVIARRLILH
jgi:hypothetical protein